MKLDKLVFAIPFIAGFINIALAQIPTAVEIEKEQQRIEVRRKHLFDARNPAMQLAITHNYESG